VWSRPSQRRRRPTTGGSFCGPARRRVAGHVRHCPCGVLRGGYDPELHKTQPVFRDKPRDTHLGLGAKALLPAEKARLAAKRKGGASATAVIADSSTTAATNIAKAAGVPQQREARGAVSAVTVERVGPNGKQLQADAIEAESEPKRPCIKDLDNGSSGGTCEVAGGPLDVWPSRGLVVRVIGRDAHLREFYGKEAVVLEADDTTRCCRIKARIGEKSQVLQGVRMEELETRVSRDCKAVRVVRGPHRGAVAELIRRDPARNVALVQLKGVESEMPLDDVCQFLA